ncbi:hypothetical protein Krac_4346 [Ktedonobacter racemifer DSM 44963]|uniref:Uncharacterized protein n=1 Tax=Ktedonobacter racemifer DSM 44963 TaxID=485913 RepID=D6TSI9_KTERA|nr:hypothetical protein Krac_4346 [Ktedonobacter racemifer DSM 44963]
MTHTKIQRYQVLQRDVDDKARVSANINCPP